MKAGLFSLRLVASKPELVPLVGFLTFASAMAVGMSCYSIFTKPDVRVNKSASSPPWEGVKPSSQMKFLKTNMEYKEIPELEKLRKEIGSYKY